MRVSDGLRQRRNSSQERKKVRLQDPYPGERQTVSVTASKEHSVAEVAACWCGRPAYLTTHQCLFRSDLPLEMQHGAMIVSGPYLEPKPGWKESILGGQYLLGTFINRTAARCTRREKKLQIFRFLTLLSHSNGCQGSEPVSQRVQFPC